MNRFKHLKKQRDQRKEEFELYEISDRKVNAVGRARQANVDKSMSSNEYISDAPGSTQKLATNISKMNRFKHLKKQRDQRKEEFELYEISDRKVNAVGRARQANVDKSMSSNEYISDAPGSTQKLATNISKMNRFKHLKKQRDQRKEEFELWVNELVEEGYDLSDYTWDEMLDIYEADSLDAMQARREKRQKANMKNHGTPGFDYSKPPSGKKGYLDSITKKEEIEIDMEMLEQFHMLKDYFIENEIAFNEDEVLEIFENISDEDFDYFMNEAKTAETIKLVGKKKDNVILNPKVKGVGSMTEEAPMQPQMVAKKKPMPSAPTTQTAQPNQQAQQVQRRQLALNKQKVALQQKAVTKKQSTDMHVEENLHEVDLSTQGPDFSNQIVNAQDKPKKKGKSLTDFKMTVKKSVMKK
jgi:hypothetical protein